MCDFIVSHSVLKNNPLVKNFAIDHKSGDLGFSRPGSAFKRFSNPRQVGKAPLLSGPQVFSSVKIRHLTSWFLMVM